MDHTIRRIIEAHHEYISKALSDHVSEDLILIGKWGFDGTTGQSEYKQKFKDGSADDGSLFVTSYVPLQLKSRSSAGEDKIVWKNPRPCSTRYCRPIRFQFIKESIEDSIQEEQYFKEKIAKLTPTQVFIDNVEYNVEHALQLTMVDGKVKLTHETLSFYK